MAEEALTINDALSLNDAVALMDAQEAPLEREDEQPAEQPAEETEAQPSADDADDPSEVIEGEDAEGDPEAQPPIAKPRSWAADDDALWSGIPRDAQEKILAREEERDSATDRALTQATDARKAAESHIEQATQVMNSLNEALPKARAVFQGRWQHWTPEYRAQLAATNAEQYSQQREQYDQEQAHLAHFGEMHEKAQAVAYQGFLQRETEVLKAVCPDLYDAKEGPARQAALATFLRSDGFTDDEIKNASGKMVALAYDGMQFRQSKTRLVAPKPAAPAAKPLRPASAAQPATSQKRQSTEAMNRLAQTGRIDDAVAYMNLKG